MDNDVFCAIPLRFNTFLNNIAQAVLMDLGPAVMRSLEQYVSGRIREIPNEIRQSFPRAARIWKCQNERDFLYGYYVGRIEEGSLRYLLKATRAPSGGYIDLFEIRGVIESHKEQITTAIESALEA